MELFATFALATTAILGLAWYYITAIIVGLLFAVAFSNDDEVGNETWLFMIILGGLGWALWGQISIADAIFTAVWYLALGSLWSIFNYARVIRKEMAIDKANGNRGNLEHYQKFISKSRITRWIAYFPFSMLEYIVGEFIIKVFKKIASMLGGTYNRITKHYFDKFFGA